MECSNHLGNQPTNQDQTNTQDYNPNYDSQEVPFMNEFDEEEECKDMHDVISKRPLTSSELFNAFAYT